MATSVEKYRVFWADKATPLANDSQASRSLLAQELRLLYSDWSPIHVLEIGCGNGRLFDDLGFPPASYRGVDFGPRMLESFHASHPDLDLVQAEGSSYCDERSYDLIFSNGVIQNFSRDMLDRHFRNARTMMHDASRLVCAGVPWRALRPEYDLGLFSPGGRASAVRRLENQVLRLLGRDLMGVWYQPEEIAVLARKHGLAARFHGSVAEPYRFHVVMSVNG